MPLPVEEDSEEGLGFYSYIDGRWERQGDVVLTHNRQVAKGSLPSLPPNLAVLRETN